MKKILSIILILIVIAIVGFIFMLYATIKTKSTSLNKYEPFKQWVGKTVVLERETALFTDKEYMDYRSDYPYMLLDSTHRQWQYVEERKSADPPKMIEITRFPSGTSLHLEKAIQYTNGVSGTSSPVFFGTIIAAGKTYKIGYQWGERDVAKNHYNIEKSWGFNQAPWQDKKDTAFYALPTAKVW